jgi:natural product precursor
MKDFKKLKLTQLGQLNLTEREMNILKGGGTPGDCCCTCQYAGSGGGSSTADNDAANNKEGKHSPGCGSGSDNGGESGSNPNAPFCFSINTNQTPAYCSQPVNCNNNPNKC